MSITGDVCTYPLMGGRLKIKKTHISMKGACKELKITKDQFKKLLVHMNIHAEKVRSKYQLSCSEANTYSLSDINKIYNSKIYSEMVQNDKKMDKKKLWMQRKRMDLANKIDVSDNFDYIDIIRNKYTTFADAVADLGETLSFLYIYRFMMSHTEKEQKMLEKVKYELHNFERLVVKNLFLAKIYPTKKGVHVMLRIGTTEVLFFVPLSGNITNDKYKTELHTKLYLYQLMMVSCRLNRMLSTSKKENDCNKNTLFGETDEKTDDALHSGCLLSAGQDRQPKENEKSHVDNIQKLDGHKKNTGIFAGLNIEIGNTTYRHWIKIVCASAGANIVEKSSDYFITEGNIEFFNDSTVYLHPAFIFNSFNKGTIQNKDEYTIGKKDIKYFFPFDSNQETYEKDVILTFSKAKQRAINSFIKRKEQNTYFN